MEKVELEINLTNCNIWFLLKSKLESFYVIHWQSNGVIMIENDDLEDSFFESTNNQKHVESPSTIEEQETSKYTIIKELGRGGMGVVYLARNNDLMRNIAIKFVLDTMLQKRFLREAQAISRLSHPNIIGIHHLDFDDKNPYIEMEYVDGCDLQEYMQKTSLDFKDRVRLLLPIVNAVAYAHQNNVIHRDIKPSNIIISKKGYPYLMDFGLAKITNVEDKSLTKTGMSIGSPGYMSPEQAEGLRRQVNTLSDIYSLGGVLYFMCCGQPPICGGNAIEVLWKSVDAKIEPPRSLCPEIPEILERICLKALQKNPQNRYQSAQQLSDDLRSYLNSGKISVGKKHLWWIRHKYKVISLLLICCFSVGFVMWRLRVHHQQLQINITQKKLALQSIRNGFYNEALEELKLAYKRKQLSVADYNMYMAFVYARLRNESLFFKHYKLTNSQQQSSMMMLLAKGEISYHNKNWQQAHTQLVIVWENAAEITLQIYAGYYLGQLHLHNQEYEKALDILTKTQQKIRNKSFLFYPQLLFFLGKAEYHTGKTTLQNLQNALVRMPNFAPVYLYLGKMHLRNSDESKALEYLQECLRMNGKDDHAHVAIADILRHQGRYSQALSMYQKARSLNVENAEAMNGIAQVVSKNMPQMERYYSMIIQELEDAAFTPPKLLERYFLAKRKAYKIDYELQQKLLNYKANFDQLLEKLNSTDHNIRDRAEKALFLSRYNPKLQEVLEKKNAKLYKKILAFTKSEQQKVLRHMLIESYFHPHMLDSITQQTLVTTIENSQENTMYRYLAALGLVRKLQFQQVKKLATRGMQKIICCAALQYADIRIKADVWPGKFKEEFSKILVAKTLSTNYPKHAKKIWNSSSEEAAFFVAQSFVQKNHPLKNEARKKLIALTKSKDSHIRSNAYYCLFSNFQQQQQQQQQQDTENIIEELWLRGMQDSDECVRLAIMEKTPKYLITDKMKSFLNSLERNRKSSMLEKIKIIKTLATKYCLQALSLYYEAEKEDPIIRVYALEKQVGSLMNMALSSDKGALQESVQKNFININVFLKSENIFLRAYGYMIYSAMVGEVLDFIYKEQDNDVKAAIILSSSIGEGASSSPLLELAQNFVRRFLKHKVAPRKHQQEKMEIIKEFMDSKSTNLSLSSYFGCAYYGSNHLREKLYNKVKSSSNAGAKKGVAMALFFRIRDRIEHVDLSTQLQFYLGMISFAKKDYRFSLVYRKQLENSQKRAYYRKSLLRVLALDPEQSDHNYYMALLCIAEGKPAEEYLYKALAKEERFVFFVELVKLLWKRDGKIPQSITSRMLKIAGKRQVYPGMLRELLHIPTPEIHRILRQNYLFYTLLNNQKFINEKQMARENLTFFEKNK